MTRMPNWQTVTLALLIFIPLCGATPEIWQDTKAYLRFDPVRPPLYPIFLWLFHVFGAYQFTMMMWVQALLNFFGLLYAYHWLSRRLALPSFFIFLILILTTIIFFLHFRMLINMLSEALAFPLFIVTFTLLVDNFQTIDLKKISILMLVGNLLILTREQFYYFYILFAALIIWHYWKHIPLKKIVQGASIVVLSILLTAMLNRSYHYFISHYFQASSATGLVLIPQALYLSRLEDANYFKNENEKKIFTAVMTQLENLKLTRQYPPIYLNPPLTLEAADDYFNIACIPIIGVLQKNFPLGLTSYEGSQLLVNISKTLYLNNVKKNMVFYLWRIAAMMGGIGIFLAFALILFSMGIRILFDRTWDPSVKQIFIVMSFLTILANAALLGFSSRYEIRYFYYSYFLYFCLSGLLVKEFFTKKINEPTIV